MVRHFFVVTGVGLALVALVFLFPTLRLGAEAVDALLGSGEGDARGAAVPVDELANDPEVRRALPGARSYSARSTLGFPLRVVELRSGGGPWVELQADDYGRWDLHTDSQLEVRAPGHSPGRANPGSRNFVLEPQFALVLRTPPGVAEQLVLRERYGSTLGADSSQLLFGASSCGESFAITATTDERTWGEPFEIEYDLETPYPVSIQLALTVTREELHELDLEDLVPSESLRDLEVVAQCAHLDEVTHVTLASETPQPVQVLRQPWGQARVHRGVWRNELEGRTGVPLVTPSTRETVHVHARCRRGCHGSLQVLGGSEDRAVELQLAPGHLVRGRFEALAPELLPAGSASVHCRFTHDAFVHDPVWDSDWSSTCEVTIGEDGSFELPLPGRGFGPRFGPRELPPQALLRISVPGYHDEVLWLDLEQERGDSLHVIRLREREPQFLLAASHGLEPALLEFETLRARDLELKVLASAPLSDGRLLVFCLPTRSFVSHAIRKRYDAVDAFVVRHGGRPVAFRRGTSGAFVRAPTHTTTLRMACHAFAPPPDSTVLLGWTWNGLSAVAYAFGRRRVGTEWELELTLPDGTSELWWSTGLEPAREPNVFGGAARYVRKLDALAIR